jgi:DNA (cytosine-5)-methyltransferase 1
MQNLGREGRAPATIVLENVCGALTSRKSADFRSLVDAIRKEGFRCGALVVDAQLFLPHSRPRLFVLAVRDGIEIDERLVTDAPQPPFHTSTLTLAYRSLSSAARASWVWWKLPVPNCRRQRFIDLIDEQPSGVEWHTPEQTQRLLGMMSAVNRAKVDAAMAGGTPVVGALYRRTRPDASGARVQRAEVRFDDTAGCLRTPNGGSSRQTILVVHGSDIRSRLLSARETARLMGLPDSYVLPSNYNEAYHLTGDGVAVPVVRHIAEHLLEPVVDQARRALTSAA